MIRTINTGTLPRLDALYWAMVLTATALGEKLGDLVSMTLKLEYGPSSVVLLALALAAMGAHLLTPLRSVSLYWSCVVLASTAGTTMADFITRALGFGYGPGAFGLIILLDLVASIRHRLVRRQPSRAPSSMGAEVLYWAAMLVADTLGTASGDFVSNGAVLGFGGGAALLAAILAAIAALAKLTRVPRSVLYWAAILATDPLGATLGDYLDKPDGLALGIVTASLILGCGLAIVVTFSMRQPLARIESEPLVGRQNGCDGLADNVDLGSDRRPTSV